MTPSDLRFKMPAEWSRHTGTLMEWPVREALWPEPFEDILPAYTRLVKAIAKFEPVTLIVRPDLFDEAAEFCGDSVGIMILEYNDSWIRDNGPTFIKNTRGELAGINWFFNGWGGKYPSNLDNKVAPEILKRFNIPIFSAPFVMEGGSIHVDGEGTLLTTEECLLNPNRNPSFSRGAITEHLSNYLGVERIIWLKRGWVGDDTDGHIDNVACFARPGVILIQTCLDPNDPNYEISQENISILKSATDALGRRFEIIPIEQPPATNYQDMRLTLSYLNFYFVNGGIILPVFGGLCESTDQKAITTIKEVFPDRHLVTVDGSVLARGGGNVHCLTQQIPFGIPALPFQS